MAISAAKLIALKRLRDNFPYYAPNCLKIKDKGGAIVPFVLNKSQHYVHDRLEEQKARTGRVRALILKSRQQGFCFSPDMRVLTADYRWVAIDSVKPGDRLFAVDENALGKTSIGRKQSRRMKTCTVCVKAELNAETFDVKFDNGVRLCVTAGHRMLFRQRGGCLTKWQEIGASKVGDYVRVLCAMPIRTEKNYEDGWFGGLLDGEGSSSKNGSRSLKVDQVDGPVLARAKAYLTDLGITYREGIDNRKGGENSKFGNKPVHRLEIGRSSDILKVLCLARPTRFTKEGLFDGHELPGKAIAGDTSWARIISIEPAGRQRVVDLQTDTKTFICEGLVSHNSTYVGGRFYHRTSLTKGVQTFILTHEQDATDNLFGMVERFHANTPLRPSTGAANAKELNFNILDAGYSVGTAGSKAVGRSKTLHLFHGSEVSRWPNAKAHFAGVVQAVPNLPGTEIILESTANGVGGEFHERWQKAEAGIGDYIAIFVPWFWTDEYREGVPPGFKLTEEEALYASQYDLDLAQMVWRRAKIDELGGVMFKQEYPATAAEAFQTTGHDSFISPEIVLAARKNTCEAIGPLVVGVDPSRFGDDRFSIAWRRGRKVQKVESRSKIGTVEAVGWIKQIIDTERPARVFMDVGGGGDRIFDIMESYGSPYDKVIKLVNFGGAPQEPNEILRDGTKRAGPKNRRAEIWQRTKDWLEQEGGADLPDSDSIQTDLCGPGYGYDLTTQQLVLESKEHMREVRKVRSPDEGDAICLTFSEPVKEPKEETKPAGARTVQSGEGAWLAS